MKYFHYLDVEVFVHSTEDKEKVLEAVKNVMGEELYGEFKRKEVNAEGYHHNPIKILYFQLTKPSLVLKAFLKLFKEVGDDLLQNLDMRVDNEGMLHIRIDKMEALNKKISLTEKGEPIVLKFKISAYPRSREGAIQTLKRCIYQYMGDKYS